MNLVKGLYFKTNKNEIVKNLYLNFNYIKKKIFF